jgi:hypothetical protein
MVLAVTVERLETARLHGEPVGRVMEKLGFVFERDTIYTGLPHVLYRRHSASSARSTSRSVV